MDASRVDGVKAPPHRGTPRLTRMFGTKPGFMVQDVASFLLRNFISSS
jgi:hypothetical protein